MMQPRADALRGVILAGAAILAAGAFSSALDRAAERKELRSIVEELGPATMSPEKVATVKREPDPAWAQLLVARQAVFTAADPGSLGGSPRERMAAASLATDNVARAERISRRWLRRRPAAWQAAMLLGASRHLQWSLAGDRRVVMEAPWWQRPLEHARLLAPGKDEPVHFLAVALVDVWPLLSEEQKSDGRDVVRSAFHDPATFRRAVQRWLGVETDRERALAAVPAEPWAYATVATALSRSGDWRDLAWVEQRRDATLPEWADEIRREFDERLRGGDVEGARAEARRLLVALTPDGRWAKAVDAMAKVMPAGTLSGLRDATLSGWLDWSLRLFARGRSGLSAAAVDRLGAALTEIEPGQRALALLAAGRLVEAESLERRHLALETVAWGPYLVAKTREVMARGETAEVARLVAVPSKTWALPWAMTVRCEGLAAVGRNDDAAACRSNLMASARDRWPATEWRWDGLRAYMDAKMASEGRLQIRLDRIPTRGAVCEVALDGSLVQLVYVEPDVDLVDCGRVEAGDHFIEVSSTVGGRVSPGDVEVVPSAPQHDRSGRERGTSVYSPSTSGARFGQPGLGGKDR